MEIKRNIFVIITMMICISLSACKGGSNIPKNTVSIDEISAAITAQIKTDFIATGDFQESDFKDGVIPGYQILKFKNNHFILPIEYDQNDLEDAILVSQITNVKSDMILVMKAKNDKDISKLESYAKKLQEEQIKSWEHYLPDQFEKVKNNIIKTVGHYVIYITYDYPEKMDEAITNLMK